MRTKKTGVKHVPPRMTHKAVIAAARAKLEAEAASRKAEAIDFATNIAQEMKRSAREATAKTKGAASEIVLPDRPTTRRRGQKTVQFGEADLKVFRKRLLKAREAALTGSDALRATGFNEAGDREADGGDGTNQTLRLQALGHAGNVSRTLQQIEEALHRIDDGSYGVCGVCGGLIRKPRLLNQPFVQTCMECQNAMEREGKP